LQIAKCKLQIGDWGGDGVRFLIAQKVARGGRVGTIDGVIWI
jgi:hypothetical protein